MSIASLQPHHQISSPAASTLRSIDQPQESFSLPASTAPSPSGASSTPPSDPLQRLASDIQALLIQTQHTADHGGATVPQAPSAPNSQTASTNPTAPAGATGHHRRHRHVGGVDANGAFDIAAASGASAPAQSAGDRSVSANVARAIKTYAGVAAAVAMPALLV